MELTKRPNYVKILCANHFKLLNPQNVSYSLSLSHHRFGANSPGDSPGKFARFGPAEPEFR